MSELELLRREARASRRLLHTVADAVVDTQPTVHRAITAHLGAAQRALPLHML